MGLLWALLQLPKVQTFAAQKAANYLSSELDVPVTLNQLEIDFWNHLVLKELYIEDLNQDTLIHLHELNIEVDQLDFSHKKLAVSIHLIQPKAKTYTLKNDSVFNHQFLINYFASSDTSTAKSDWSFKLNGIQVSDGQYSYDNFNRTKQEYGVDYFHISADSIELIAEDFIFINDTIRLNMKLLSVKEQSGFILDQLASKAKIYKGVFDLLQSIQPFFYSGYS